MKLAYVMALAGLGLVAGRAEATFTLVDNFDSYAVGSDVASGGVTGWTQGGSVNTGFATVQANPGGAGNVLQLFNDPTAANTSVYQSSGAITMPTGTTPATLFFMMRAKNDGLLHEGTAGMTDSAAPVQFGDGRGWTMFGNDGDGTASAALNQVGVGDYTQNATNTQADPWGWNNGLMASGDVWYKIWQVYHVDGTGVTGGTYDTYIQGGTQFPTQTLIKSGFLRGSAAATALTTMVMLTDDPSVSFFDNIYVDTGSVNLSNPVPTGTPEPATIGLLGMALAGLIGRRRRQGSMAE